jgi:hypothetical protein
VNETTPGTAAGPLEPAADRPAAESAGVANTAEPAGVAFDEVSEPADAAGDEAAEPADAAGDDVAEPATGSLFGSHPIVLYTIKRLLLLVVVGGVLYLLHVRGVWLILFAFLVSGFIAMVALRDSREGASYVITHAVARVNERIDASARAEDVDDLDDLDDVGSKDAAGDGDVPVEKAAGQP